MAYDHFYLLQVKRAFDLTFTEQLDLFANVAPMMVGDLLQAILAENIPLALAIHTEKARSELIIMPILVELRRLVETTDTRLN